MVPRLVAGMALRLQVATALIKSYFPQNQTPRIIYLNLNYGFNVGEDAMKRILIAVDDTKGTKEIFNKTLHVCKCLAPEQIILTFVEKFEGRSFLEDLLEEPELSTLKEALEGTEYKEALDARANKVLSHYKNLLEDSPPVPPVKTDLRTGHPAEEILKAAKEENADLIIMGSRSKRASSIFMGSVSRAVSNMAEVPVMIVK